MDNRSLRSPSSSLSSAGTVFPPSESLSGASAGATISNAGATSTSPVSATQQIQQSLPPSVPVIQKHAKLAQLSQAASQKWRALSGEEKERWSTIVTTREAMVSTSETAGDEVKAPAVS